MNRHNAMQDLIDLLTSQWQRERAATQMTLGKLINTLDKMPANTQITGLAGPHSYRGYYCDLALQPVSGTVSAKSLLLLCYGVLGRHLEGYKGGLFPMDENTPVWVASYGDCGTRLMDLHPDGSISVAPEESQTE